MSVLWALQMNFHSPLLNWGSRGNLRDKYLKIWTPKPVCMARRCFCYLCECSLSFTLPFSCILGPVCSILKPSSTLLLSPGPLFLSRDGRHSTACCSCCSWKEHIVIVNSWSNILPWEKPLTQGETGEAEIKMKYISVCLLALVSGMIFVSYAVGKRSEE